MCCVLLPFRKRRPFMLCTRAASACSKGRHTSWTSWAWRRRGQVCILLRCPILPLQSRTLLFEWSGKCFNLRNLIWENTDGGSRKALRIRYVYGCIVHDLQNPKQIQKPHELMLSFILCIACACLEVRWDTSTLRKKVTGIHLHRLQRPPFPRSTRAFAASGNILISWSTRPTCTCRPLSWILLQPGW
mgnify:CR=1 FL=1